MDPRREYWVPYHGPKQCTKCQIIKPYEDFPLRPTRRDPLQRGWSCKKCEYSRPRSAASQAQRQAYRLANKSLFLSRANARQRARRQANPASFRANEQRYRETHKTEIAARGKAWHESHPAQVAAKGKRRRAHEKQAPVNDLTHAQWLEIQAAQDHRCYYCQKRCKGRLTQDHIIPLSKGGSHTLHNVIGACHSCNARKNTNAPPIPVQPLLLTVAAPKPHKKKVS